MKYQYKILIGLIIFIIIELIASQFFPQAYAECPWHKGCPVCIKAPCSCYCEENLDIFTATRHIWAPILIASFVTIIYALFVRPIGKKPVKK